MDYESFIDSIKSKKIPQTIDPILKALWLDASDDWDAAHQIVQSMYDTDAELVHAYLHRKEGDLGNASYWYSRCGKKAPNMSLEQEWELITEEMLKKDK